MPTQRLGIIMHGVTGRMGMNQHLIRSIVAIRDQGGVTLANGDKVMPDPILIGRNAEKIEALAKAHGIERWGTDLDTGPRRTSTTPCSSTPAPRRCAPTLLAKAIRAGKHVYCEKPIATNLNEAVEIARLAKDRASSTARCRTSCSCRACASWTCCAAPASSAACCRCGWSSATGYSKATCSRSSGRAGTTARKKAAA